jgi:hypothetical protein
VGDGADGGVIITTTDAGGTWTSQSVPAGVGELNSVTCQSSSDCDAVGDGNGSAGSIVATTDGGAVWSSKLVPSGAGDLDGVSCTSSAACYAVGANTGNTGPVIISTADGSTWSSDAVPPGVTSLTSVACVTSTLDCTAVGPGNGVLIVTSGGPWASETAPSGTGDLNGVACSSAMDCYAVGEGISGDGDIIATTDGGALWASQALLTGVDTLESIACVPSSTDCTTVGVETKGSGAIIATTDGSTWNSQTVPAGVNNLAGVTCPSPAHCFGVGSTGNGAASAGVIVATSDGGGTWTDQTVPAGVNSLDGIVCTSISDCIAVGTDDDVGGAILTTTNGGSAWSAQPVPVATNGLNGVACSSSSDCFAVGTNEFDTSGVIFATTDGGGTWTTDPVPTGATFVTSVACPPSGTQCYAVGYKGNGGAGGAFILTTTDGGSTWTSQTTPAAVGGLEGITCPSTSNCTAVGNNGTISAGELVATTNGGTTWTTQSAPAGVLQFRGVTCGSTSDCTTVGYGGDGGVIVATTNGGTVWGTQASPTGVSYLFATVCVSSSQCYAVGDGDTSPDDGGLILAGGTPPSVSTASLPPATVGSAYSTPLAATGGASPYTWSVSGGSLPEGLNLDPSSGIVSGTPTAAGVSDVTFEVTDNLGFVDTASLPLTVLNDPGVYVPLTPTRICDTRAGNPSGLNGLSAQCNGLGNAGETLSAGGTLDIDVAGSFGVPASDVTAAVLNVTEAGASGAGYFTLFPTGSGRPTASDLNFTANHAVPNLVEVGVGTSGQVSLYSAARADAIVDLEGYVTTTAQAGAGLYDALPTPARICDTRGGNPSQLSGGATQCNPDVASGSPDNLIGPTTPLTVTVTGLGGVPATGVEAAVLNVTVAKSKSAGYVTAYPAGATQPTASNVNFGAGQAIANRVIVPVNPTTGQVTLYSSSSTDIIVDVSGYYTSAGGVGAEFTPEPAPARICDSRGSNPSGLVSPYTQCNTDVVSGSPANPIGSAVSRTVQATGLGYVPTGATAVVLNLTAVAPSVSTYLTLYPEGSPPTTSDLNPPAGGVLANLVVATLTNAGTFDVYNAAGNTNIVIDVAGWYTNDDTTAQSNLNTAFLDAKALYLQNSQSYSPSATMVTELAGAEPALTFTAAASTSGGQVSVTTSADGNSIILASQADITGNCWYIVDNENGVETASPPWSDAGAAFVGAGAWFGEDENTGSPPTCQASSAPAGANSATQAFLTTGFPDL